MSFKVGETRTDFQARCPYNPNHQMPESRLLFHISKGCKDKEAKAHLFAHCPYNYLHIVRKEEVDRHLVNCKSKPQQQEAGDVWTVNDTQIQEAINKQFGKQCFIQEEKEQISRKNETIPGLDQDTSMKTKKKRIRQRKSKADQLLNQEEEDDCPDWDKQVEEAQNPKNILKEETKDIQFLKKDTNFNEIINQTSEAIDDDEFFSVQDHKIKKKNRNQNNDFDDEISTAPRQRNQRRNR